MNSSAIKYQAWLLRLWRETPSAPWRIALENISNGERQGFADLESLLAYLQTVCADREEYSECESEFPRSKG